MNQPKPRQLPFVFADSPQGNEDKKVVDASTTEPSSVHTANGSQLVESATSPAADTGRLLERVAASENLALALEKVVSNQGAPGVDRQTVQLVAQHAHKMQPMLQDALLSETYIPGDIRRVWIPKPGGGQRGLGIPNVIDRWVQQAVLQVLEPIYEPIFHDSSHGFRPGRGSRTAIEQSVRYVNDGRRYTVDIDMEKFFDRVHHQRLLDRVAQRVSDRRILRIIRLMLKAHVVLPEGARERPQEGTPQGGPLSPLLSNIVLDELDQELDRRGLCFVRYADDCNIYVRSERAGHRVMDSIRRFIEGRLRLKVNEEKSAVALARDRHFLGFRVGGNARGPTVQLSKRTLSRLDARIRELTPRNWGGSLSVCLERLNSYLRGWSGYFSLCTREIVRSLRFFDSHIRRRLRALIVCQKKRPRYLYRHLVRHGVSQASAKATAYSRRGPWWQSNSGGMQRAYPNKWFEGRLVSLEELWRQNRHDWRSLSRGATL